MCINLHNFQLNVFIYSMLLFIIISSSNNNAAKMVDNAVYENAVLDVRDVETSQYSNVVFRGMNDFKA